jgi:hypothetical protein
VPDSDGGARATAAHSVQQYVQAAVSVSLERILRRCRSATVWMQNSTGLLFEISADLVRRSVESRLRPRIERA